MRVRARAITLVFLLLTVGVVGIVSGVQPAAAATTVAVPQITSANPLRVDPLNPTAVTITWTAGSIGTPATSYLVTKPDRSTVTVTSTPFQYVVSTTDSSWAGDIQQVWTVAGCTASGCGDADQIVIDRRASIPTSTRINAFAGTPPTVTWTSSGNFMWVRSTTLNLDTGDSTPHEKWTNTPSATPLNLPLGTHEIDVLACKFTSGSTVLCPSAYPHAMYTTSGLLRDFDATPTSFSYSVSVGAEVKAGQPIARLTGVLTGKAKYLDVLSPTDGRVESLDWTGGTPSSGTQLARLSPFTTIRISALATHGSDPLPTWSEQPWTNGFQAGTNPQYYPAASDAGLPLDVLLKGSEFWGVGEFHRSVTNIEGTTEVTRSSPVRVPTTDHNARAKPFAGPFVPPNDTPTYNVGVSDATALSERVIGDGAGRIWFTEGGAGNGSADDHSRIVSFDRTLTDSPSTWFDDRMCAYDLPETRNEVYGLAWAGGRVWFAEARTSEHPTPDHPERVDPNHGVISSFDPAHMPCEHDPEKMLDYQAPAAMSSYRVAGDSSPANLAKRINYCSTPFANDCITKTDIAGSGALTQLGVDPSSTASNVVLWATESYGGPGMLGNPDAAIVRVAITTSGTTHTVTPTRYPIPWSSRDPQGTHTTDPFPWRIEADGSAVYFSEFLDADVVRLDKSLANSSACLSLTSGTNPCMTEVHVPLRTAAVMNSIQLTNVTTPSGLKHRLYFALDNGQIGYVDRDEWAAKGALTGGVLYTGMTDLFSPERRDVSGPNYNGISIDGTGTGNGFAISDFGRRQFIRLTMKSI